MNHVPAGLNYYPKSWDPTGNPFQQFLDQTTQAEYVRALYPYQDNIIIHFASHIHRAMIKAPVTSLPLTPGSTTEKPMNLTYVIFQSPSITPIYNNNPSYSMVEMSADQQITEVTSQSLQLYRSILYNATDSWTTIKWSNDFGVNLNSAESVRELYQKMMHDSALFYEFEAKAYGLAWYETQMHRFFSVFYEFWNNPYQHQFRLCSDSYMEYS